MFNKSQWSVTTTRNKPLGKLFSANVIDLLSFSEFDVIVGGKAQSE
jgi:hypothetical protein